MLAKLGISLLVTERNAWVRQQCRESKSTYLNFIHFYKCRAPNPTSKILHRLHSLKSKVVQIALAGLGIHPQKGQRDYFTHDPPCFDANVFGVPIIVKSSLTSGFFQTFAFTHHSSLMMPAWGLLQWQRTRKNTYKRNFCQIRARMLASLTKKATAECWRHNENLSLSVLKQHKFLLELLICNHEIRQIA